MKYGFGKKAMLKRQSQSVAICAYTPLPEEFFALVLSYNSADTALTPCPVAAGSMAPNTASGTANGHGSSYQPSHFSEDRWTHTVRPYSQADVEKLRGVQSSDAAIHTSSNTHRPCPQQPEPYLAAEQTCPYCLLLISVRLKNFHVKCCLTGGSMLQGLSRSSTRLPPLEPTNCGT